MKTLVCDNGQIAIPKADRDNLGSVTATVLEIDTADGKPVGVKRESTGADSKRRCKGRIPVGRTVDEYLRRSRG